jgi:hypothetical protein
MRTTGRFGCRLIVQVVTLQEEQCIIGTGNDQIEIEAVR